MTTALLSIAYFPPIQYFSKFFAYNIVIEKYEHFIKQTYRNRTQILTSTGVHSLTVPVKKKNNTIITDVLIDNTISWQRNHLRSLQTAYGNSPFFEYLIEDLIHIFTTKYDYLWDLNIATIDAIISILDLDVKINFSTDFFPPAEDEFEKLPFKDFRYIIKPKNPPDDLEFVPNEYRQVFAEKFAFIPNLSILDILFNTGPEAKSIIKNSYRAIESA